MHSTFPIWNELKRFAALSIDWEIFGVCQCSLRMWFCTQLPPVLHGTTYIHVQQQFQFRSRNNNDTNYDVKSDLITHRPSSDRFENYLLKKLYFQIKKAFRNGDNWVIHILFVLFWFFFFLNIKRVIVLFLFNDAKRLDGYDMIVPFANVMYFVRIFLPDF